MGAPVLQSDLESRLTDVEDQLKVLQQTSPLIRASVRDGQIIIQDANGNAVLVIGKQTDGTYGIWALDAAGNVLVKLGQIDTVPNYGLLVQDVGGQKIFRVRSDGNVFPQTAIPLIANGGATVSNTSGIMRPGTNNAAFTELWRGDFSSIGSKVDYDLLAYANGGNMDWRILCYELGAAPFAVVGPNNETTNVQRTGTFTIPAGALMSGTDPAGRSMTVRVEARLNAAGIQPTGDIAVNAFQNHG